MIRNTLCFAVALTWIIGASENALKAAPRSSRDNVKITVSADKQIVTLNLEIAKGWHLYANPVGNPDLLTCQTVVTFFDGDGKPVAAKIEYPQGIVVKNPVIDDFYIYEGTITIKAKLAAPPNRLVVAIVAFQTTNDSMNLLPAKVILKVK